MTTTALVTFLIGASCYGLSVALAIRLRKDLTVPIAAGLGPPLAAYGVERGGDPMVVIAVPALLALAVAVASRRTRAEVLTHAFLYAAIATLAIALSSSSEVAAFLTAVAGTAVYAISDGARQFLTAPAEHGSAARQTWFLLLAVLLCSSGLTVLIADRMGWPAFVAMAGVLALTKREFDGFAKSSAALTQTVDALDRLAASEH